MGGRKETKPAFQMYMTEGMGGLWPQTPAPVVLPGAAAGPRGTSWDGAALLLTTSWGTASVAALPSPLISALLLGAQSRLRSEKCDSFTDQQRGKFCVTEAARGERKKKKKRKSDVNGHGDRHKGC